MDASHLVHICQVPRVLILHLQKACTHMHFCTPKISPCFDSVSQEKQEDRLTPAVTPWPCLAAAESFCRAMLTGVGMLIQWQLVCSENQVCVWALVIQPSLFVARKHRGQARENYGSVKLAGFLQWPGTSLSCFNKGRERSPTPTKQENPASSTQWQAQRS